MSVVVDPPPQPPLKWTKNAIKCQRHHTGGALVVRDGVVVTVVPQGSPADVALKNQQQRKKKARAIAEARKQKNTAARKAAEKRARATEKKLRRRKPSAKNRAALKRTGAVWK